MRFIFSSFLSYPCLFVTGSSFPHSSVASSSFFVDSHSHSTLAKDRDSSVVSFRDQMALRGVWKLQKLIVSYCDWGGSSKGIRLNHNLLTIKLERSFESTLLDNQNASSACLCIVPGTKGLEVGTIML